jgi:hypothetical protein
MAEVLFFMTESDSGEFADFLIRQFDARFAMDESPTAELLMFDQRETLLEAILHSRYSSRFWVLSHHWQKYPLAVREVNTNDGRHFFCALHQHGGPAFDFIVRRHEKDNGDNHLVCGSFSDFFWYVRDTAYLEDRAKYRTFLRPAEMKRAYGMVQKYLRQMGKRTVCRETGKAGPWVLPEALKAFREGTWLRTGEWHFEPKTSR